MNAKEIIKKHLVENGYDGLCTEECGCGIKELVACGFDPSNCVPARKHIVTQEDCDKGLLNPITLTIVKIGDEVYLPAEEQDE